MVTQQVVAPPSHAVIFVTLTVREGRESDFRELLPSVGGIARSVSFRYPDGDLLCVVGLGSALWDRLVFHGDDASIVGIAAASDNAPVALPADVRDLPTAVPNAISQLRLDGVGGPYSLLLCADLYTRVAEKTDEGYPVSHHLARMLEDENRIIWAPGLDEGRARRVRARRRLRAAPRIRRVHRLPLAHGRRCHALPRGDPPIGLPAFAFASRALVVGDTKQLAPVWSVDEETDRETAEAAGIDASAWESDLRRRGLTCSARSSRMRASMHATRWSHAGGELGLFLSEHFRCHPDIIGFCNALLYDGLLEPRPPASDSLLHSVSPAFVFQPVPGSMDSPSGSSRVNQVEAEHVAHWIVENYGQCLRRYNTNIEDADKRVPADKLIGVVTPFAAQASLIRRTMRNVAATSGVDLPGPVERLVTVGTAHRLQGAERPIILFSPVYGEQSDRSSSIDMNRELMNVAVSRAKDLFLVLGAKKRWGNGPVFEVMSSFATLVEPQLGTVPDHGSDLDEETRAEDAASPTTTGAHETVDEDGRALDPSPLPAHSAAEERAQPLVPPTREPVGVTAMLASWRETGILRPEDATLTPRELNARLHEIGVLVMGENKEEKNRKKEKKEWRPSRLAHVLGLSEELRTGAVGRTYYMLLYSPKLQRLLLELYRDGAL